jgi:hypothetical protein
VAEPHNDIPVELQAALAERYALHHVLGRGGMATVLVEVPQRLKP